MHAPLTPERLTDSQTLDAAADVLEKSPELQLLGGALAAQLRGYAALLRGEPTCSRDPRV